MRSFLKKAIIFINAAVLVFGTVASVGPCVMADKAPGQQQDTVTSGVDTIPGYYEYISSHKDAAYPATEDISAVYTGGTGVQYPVTYREASAAVEFLQDGAKAAFKVNVPQEGFYALQLKCMLEKAKLHNAVYSVYVNGSMLNRALEGLSFPRKYRDEEVKTDSKGNQLRPAKDEVFEWTTFCVSDSNSNSDGWMPIYLNAGENTVEFQCDTGVMLTELQVIQPQAADSYDAYLQTIAGKENNTPSDYYQQIEAEKPLYTSHSQLYPTFDRASAGTSPQDSAKLLLNTIGQSSWNSPGQWIEWEITVPESGLYQIGFRMRQNEVRGRSTLRRVSLDGEVLFDELEQIRFNYGMNWQTVVLGEETPYSIYLEGGKTHILRMEATYGSLDDALLQIESLCLEMMATYREIIMITGTGNAIDSYRDYMLDEQIPTLMDSLSNYRQRLKDIKQLLLELEAMANEDAVTIDRLVYRIEGFLENPETIPSGLSDFCDSIVSISAQLQSLKSQPLELDYIFVKGAERETPKANVNFFSQLWFDLKVILSSYTEDYGSLSEEKDAQINVWVSLGRDQGQIIKNLVDNYFSPQYNVRVNLSIMQTGVNEAVATGKNPDILLFAGDVVNLASRGVLADISKYDGFNKLKERFAKEAFVPFTYQNGVYAVPLEQTVNMMFYRTDIFEEMGLEAPKTWDDFLKVLNTLQRNHLTACMPAGADTTIFELKVYQNGGTIFTPDLSAVDLASDACYSAFREWTEYYTRYSMEPEAVLFDRFRSGEAPLGVGAVTMYNQFRYAAPEIDGLWEMIPLPQTEQADGTLSNMTSGTVTPAMVFKNDNEELCLEFLDWFTSAEIQAAYGQEVEAILGIGARYMTANLEAVEQMNWTAKESAVLRSEMERMVITPAVPASYYVKRNLTNAFRKVYNSGYSPREALLTYQDVINSEITRKNDELARRAERDGRS